MSGRIKTNVPGFTILELIIAIIVMSILGAIIIPNFIGRTPRYEREVFIARLNELTALAWRNAVTTHKIHRILFNFQQKQIEVQADTGEKDREGKALYARLKGQYTQPIAAIPDTIEIKQFIVEGFDEMTRFVGRPTVESWFYVVPEGMTQEVIINFVDTKDKINRRPRPIGLVLNPFTAEFKTYDSFQK